MLYQHLPSLSFGEYPTGSSNKIEVKYTENLKMMKNMCTMVMIYGYTEAR